MLQFPIEAITIDKLVTTEFGKIFFSHYFHYDINFRYLNALESDLIFTFRLSSPFSNAFISSLYFILRILFSNTGPYILRVILLSNILFCYC